MACIYCNENNVKYLIEHGANIYKENKNGNIPLIMACRNHNENIVKYLFEHIYDVNIKNKNGTTLLITCLFIINILVLIFKKN